MSAATSHDAQASTSVPEPAQALATANNMATGAWEQGPLDLERLRERAKFYASQAHADADLIGDIHSCSFGDRQVCTYGVNLCM